MIKRKRIKRRRFECTEWEKLSIEEREAEFYKILDSMDREKYGRSPGMDSLFDVKAINEFYKMQMDVAQKIYALPQQLEPLRWWQFWKHYKRRKRYGAIRGFAKTLRTLADTTKKKILKLIKKKNE